MSWYGSKKTRQTANVTFIANVADAPVSVGGTITSGQSLSPGRAMVRANANSPWVPYTSSVSVSGELLGFLLNYADSSGTGMPYLGNSGELEVAVFIKGSVYTSKVDFGTGNAANFKAKTPRITYL